MAATTQAKRKLDDQGRQWFALCSEGRREFTVQAELRDRGFDAYSPCETRWVRHARRKVAVGRPYIPRYVFFGMDAELQNFHQVLSVRGVDRIIGTAGQPIPIPFWWVDELRGAETLGEFDHTVDRNKLVVTPGRAVRVIAGHFTGFTARIIEARGDRRVRILLQEMGRLAPGPLEIDTDKLEAA